ncbi:MAG: hypothetical protein RIQ56_116 [Candidatus Parcubacteria bacterium]|jgi:YidC/Oxa1 family membrane protein insertase
MAELRKKTSQYLEFALIFLIVYILSQYGLKYFFPEQFGGKTESAPLVLTASNVTLGNNATITLKNNTEEEYNLPARCPEPPLDVFRVTGESASDEKREPVTSSEIAIPCTANALQVPAGKSEHIDLNPWKYSIFGTVGTYEIRIPMADQTGSGTLVSTRFEVKNPGFFTKIFRTFITKPFLNFLILIASILPGHNLGVAIIILTLVVKLLLFFPTQHALEGQRKMQQMQPKIDALKEQYKGNQEMIQKETMRLWKEHGVNPVQSCLPMLIQFPILIGLFYVIRDGSTLALSRELIYSFYQQLDWTFSTQFLGLDLLKPSVFIFPPLLVLLQFGQMKLSFAMSERKRKAKEGTAEKKVPSAQQTQQQVMLYGLPLMIGFFAFQFPAAVSLYWGVSTLFAIGQQIVVNRKTP